MVLAVAPRDFLDEHAATGPALDTAHAVEQEHQKAPNGNEFKAPLGEMIVARSRLVASGADVLGSGARPHGDLDALAAGGEHSLLIDEAAKTVTLV